MKLERTQVLTGLLIATLVGVALPAEAGRWVRLGQRTVTDRVDRDTIVVGADEGRFQKLQLRATGSKVRVHRIEITFGNGEKQVIKKDLVLSRGEKSPVLDLDGGQRVIRKVEFTYQEASLRRKKASVTLWGRR